MLMPSLVMLYLLQIQRNLGVRYLEVASVASTASSRESSRVLIYSSDDLVQLSNSAECRKNLVVIGSPDC